MGNPELTISSPSVLTLSSPIKLTTRIGPPPLASCQRELLDQLWSNPDAKQSPISRCFRISGTLNTAILENAFNELARRHEVFRTTFPLVNGTPEQIIAPTFAFSPPIVDLQAEPAVERE